MLVLVAGTSSDAGDRSYCTNDVASTNGAFSTSKNH